MRKIDKFCEKYDVLKTFSLIIANMITSMLYLKIEQEGWGIAYAILSALWFIAWTLEIISNTGGNKNENND